MIVKVCGMRDPENIKEVSALGVDLIGFIFHPKSPRFVKMLNSEAGILPDYVADELKVEEGKQVKSQGVTSTDDVSKPTKKPKRVGVFVDEMPQSIITRVVNFGLDYIQLHGQETRETCENLRATIDPDIKPGIQIIKAISVSTAEDIQKYKEYVGAVDLFLFDTKTKLAGGSGRQFDWSVLQAYDGDTPFLLSGGIGPEDAERVKEFHHPKCIGVDLNSKFEIEPALKDVNKLQAFLEAIK